jgi:hypothetical protein
MPALHRAPFPFFWRENSLNPQFYGSLSWTAVFFSQKAGNAGRIQTIQGDTTSGFFRVCPGRPTTVYELDMEPLPVHEQQDAPARGNIRNAGIPASTPGAADQAALAGASGSPAAVLPGSGSPATIELSLGKLAFSQSIISVPAAANIVIYFHYLEPSGSSQVTGITHNFAVYDTPAAEIIILRRDILPGGRTFPAVLVPRHSLPPASSAMIFTRSK